MGQRITFCRRPLHRWQATATRDRFAGLAPSWSSRPWVDSDISVVLRVFVVSRDDYEGQCKCDGDVTIPQNLTPGHRDHGATASSAWWRLSDLDPGFNGWSGDL